MDRTLTELSADEFEELIERTIDKRMAVWLTQLLDYWMLWRIFQKRKMQTYSPILRPLSDVQLNRLKLVRR